MLPTALTLIGKELQRATKEVLVPICYYVSYCPNTNRERVTKSNQGSPIFISSLGAKSRLFVFNVAFVYSRLENLTCSLKLKKS